MQTKDKIAGSLFGLIVGDALGVPVEFRSRGALDADPVTGMRGFGTHHQPAGTWSDDSSLILCLVESLIEGGIDFDDQARRFVRWLDEGHWTPHGKVFDVGIATSGAISRLRQGVDPTTAGSTAESSCGNGSLMRISPLAFTLARTDQPSRIETTMRASRLTHGHPRCQLACVFFVEVLVRMLFGTALPEAIEETRKDFVPLVTSHAPQELGTFEKLLYADLPHLDRKEISGSGYVIDCLEASLWSALRATTFAEAVLTAVNLGDDTDTTGAVCGAIAGLQYGLGGIPLEWRATLARHDDLVELVNRFTTVCETHWG